MLDWRRFGFGGCAAALLMFSGCGSDAPPGGADAGPRDAGGSTRDAAGSDAARADGGAVTHAVEAMIGPEGGVAFGAGIALGIPAGALAAPTRITVDEVTGVTTGLTGVVGRVLRFEPAGTRFAQPVLINVDVPASTTGMLWWSREGNDSILDPIGYAVDGRARAWVTHFSVAVAASDGCTIIDASSQDCACRGNDLMDALCVSAPPGDCLAAGGWVGTPGGMCSGYGLRDEFTIRCSCLGPMGQTLCPVPHDLPAETCPGGETLFTGDDGGSCFGYYMMTEVTDTRVSQGTSGTLAGCAPVLDGQVWRTVVGTLGDCTPRMGPPPMRAPGTYTPWTPPPTHDTLVDEPTLQEPDMMPPMGVACSPMPMWAGPPPM